MGLRITIDYIINSNIKYFVTLAFSDISSHKISEIEKRMIESE
jgi:hypothetical protein